MKPNAKQKECLGKMKSGPVKHEHIMRDYSLVTLWPLKARGLIKHVDGKWMLTASGLSELQGAGK